MTRLYLVPDVSEDAVFITQTRKEISKIEWHDISSLPAHPGSQGANRYFVVAPFVVPLEKWCRQQLQARKKNKRKNKKNKINNNNNSSNSNNDNISNDIKDAESPLPDDPNNMGILTYNYGMFAHIHIRMHKWCICVYVY